MKVRYLIGAAAIAGLALTPAVALAQATHPAASTAKVDDGALKSRIESRFKSSATLKDSDIDVSVDHGVVTLSGTVHSEAQSLRARSLAKVAGVTDVNNKLTVDSKGTRAMDKAGDKTDRAMDKAGDKADRTMDKAGRKTDRAMDKAADKSDRAMDKAGDKTARAARHADAKASTADKDGGLDANITDAWITTKIKASFLNEDPLKGSDINVDTNNHVVTLKGTVASAAGRTRAVSLAKQTKGVTRVVDNLTIAAAR